MELKEKLEKYIQILAVHEWRASLGGARCECDFCRRGRHLSRRWVELTRKFPSLLNHV